MPHFFSHRLSMAGLWPTSSLSAGCVVPLRGNGAIFCHTDSGRVGRVWSAWEKFPWNTPLWLGIEPGPRGGQTRRFIHSFTELSRLWPPGGQTVRFIHSPTELSWPGQQGGQAVRYIHSPIQLLWLIVSHRVGTLISGPPLLYVEFNKVERRRSVYTPGVWWAFLLACWQGFCARRFFHRAPVAAGASRGSKKIPRPGWGLNPQSLGEMW